MNGLYTFSQRFFDRCPYKTDWNVNVRRTAAHHISAVYSKSTSGGLVKNSKFFPQSFGSRTSDYKIFRMTDKIGDRTIQLFATDLKQTVHNNTTVGKNGKFCCSST